MRNTMLIRAYRQKIYAKDNGELIRTIPIKGSGSPYIGYIKTTIDEVRVFYDNKIVFEALCGGIEITKEEYDRTELTAINKI